MKILRFFLLVLLFSGSAFAETNLEKIKSEAEDCANALIREDFGKVLDYTHPRILEMSGGKDGLLKVLKSTFGQMKSQGFEMVSVEIGTPEIVREVEGWYITFIPQKIIMKVGEGRLLTDGHLLGISENIGDDWHFIDVSPISQQQFAVVFPELGQSVTLPSKTQPVFLEN